MKEPVAGNEPLTTGYTCRDPRAGSFRVCNQLRGAHLRRGDTEQARFKYQRLALPQKAKDPGKCSAQGPGHKAGGWFTHAQIFESSGSQLAYNWTVGAAHPS